MRSHPTRDEIQRFRQKTHTPQELVSIARHLKKCASCRQALAVLEHSLHQGGHLTYEQKEGYLDGGLTQEERASVEAHVRICETCFVEVEHLRAFSTMLRDDVFLDDR